MNRCKVEHMVTVRVPQWAASNRLFTFHVDVDSNMPPPATASPTELTITGFELTRAAVFSGRPSHLLQNPQSPNNAAFAQWRATSCLHHLEPVTINSRTYLRRPTIFNNEVDPTEKGHLNFALGSALTLAYLKNKLGIGWLAHYSLLHNAPQYNIVRNAPGRVEPDFIGLDHNLHFITAEAKGRMALDNKTKTNLRQKTQTGVVNSVNNQRILRKFGIAAITGGPSIELFATDPEIEVALPTPRAWVARYYKYVRAVCGDKDEEIRTEHESFGADKSEFDLVPVQISLPRPADKWSSELISEEQERENYHGLTIDPEPSESDWRRNFEAERDEIHNLVSRQLKESEQKEDDKWAIFPDLTTITALDA